MMRFLPLIKMDLKKTANIEDINESLKKALLILQITHLTEPFIDLIRNWALVMLQYDARDEMNNEYYAEFTLPDLKVNLKVFIHQ